MVEVDLGLVSNGMTPPPRFVPLAGSNRGPDEGVLMGGEDETGRSPGDLIGAPIPAGEPPPDYVEALGDPDLSDGEVLAVLGLAVRHPGLPLADRMDALTHLGHLVVPGAEGGVLLPLAKDPQLPMEVMEEMMDEALNREFTWQAELMLTVLEGRPEESLKEAARRHLVFLTDVDQGDDVARWRQAVEEAARHWK